MSTSGRPWMKFFTADWQADQSLRLCSAAARGVWIECMCIMHGADPYGHLVINGKPVTEAELSGLTNIPVDQIAASLTELEARGVFSRNRNDVVYSRRMTRDEKKARTSRQNGSRGGNPKLCKERGNPPRDNPPVNPPLKVVDITHIPEARGQSPDSESYTDSELPLRESENDREAAPNGAGSGKSYSFEGKIFRLTAKDFADWKKAYRHIDLMAELYDLDAYYHRTLAGKDRKDIFHRMSGAVRKRNQKAMDDARANPVTPGQRKRMELF